MAINPKVLQFLTRYKIPREFHDQIDAALKGRGKTKSLGGFREAEDAIDDLADKAGIPMFKTNEMTGKMERTQIAEDLLELMKLLGGG